AMPNRDGGATPDDPPPGDTQFDAYRSESATQDTVGGRPAIATVPAGKSAQLRAVLCAFVGIRRETSQPSGGGLALQEIDVFIGSEGGACCGGVPSLVERRRQIVRIGRAAVQFGAEKLLSHLV
ncbi:MAG TPA: hypothetical protein VMG35_28855, partial [Bryobacteraceae bacterium]|nr:hypothetical protein [Bryobacteraceae bacterium]